MASVTSLDRDLRKMRLEKYTPQAANEVRSWIEDVLGEPLASGDLLNALKDGVALCKLVNLAVAPGVKFKTSRMPFVQMENISHFLRACQSPPLTLHSHDVFSTVDLYEHKDPAQVLQCLGAFSRVAHQVQPSRFPRYIGPKAKTVTPQSTGNDGRPRGASNVSHTSSAYNPGQARGVTSITPTKTGDSGSGRWTPAKNSPDGSSSVSSWSKKEHEGATNPAWNVVQYGYMGGASQGQLGISFGSRRQITSDQPQVLSLAEKEKKRKEKEAEEERLRVQAEEAEHIRRVQREAEEEQAKRDEEEQWAAETRKQREQERQKAEEEKRKWEEEERRWKLEEERRQREEREAEARQEGENDVRLQGQSLSQYHAEQSDANDQSARVKELELELEKAREREHQYELERQERRSSRSPKKTSARSRSRPRLPAKQPSDSWHRDDERDYLRQQWSSNQQEPSRPSPPKSPRPVQEVFDMAPPQPPRPLPEPSGSVRVKTNHTGPSSRPLPDPAKYASPPRSRAVPKFQSPPVAPAPSDMGPPPPQNRTDRYLSSNPAPAASAPRTTYANELGAYDGNAERDAEDRRRLASQQKTQQRGWASKSLLEREMEMERQRQQEWEEEQKATAAAAAENTNGGNGVDGIGGGVGGRWDVSQFSGYTGGDGQNRGTQGIGAGRRPIVGPRPPPGR